MKTVEKWVQNVLKKRLAKDYDCVIAVDGDEREGKSTLAYHMCKIADSDFPGKNGWKIIYSYEDFFYAVKHAKRYSALMFDEAGEVLYSLDFNKPLNKEIKKAFMTIGAKNLFFILVMPSIWDMDTYFRNRRTRYWFHVPRRGICQYRKRNKGPFSKEPFWNQVFQDRYPPLPEEEEKFYKKRKMGYLEKKNQQEGISVTDKWRKIDNASRPEFLLEVKEKTGWSYQKMAEKLNITPQALHRFINNEKVKTAPKIT